MTISTLFRVLLVSLLAIVASQKAFATHNRAGEIRVEQLSGFTVRATVVTYTAFQGNSNDADRDSVLVAWGDGTEEWVIRSNGPLNDGFPSGEPLGDNIKKNIYVANHTYSGRGQYVIGMQDPNRVDNIRNINNGGSTEVRFYVRTVFTFLDANFQGPNSTPELLQPPIDNGCVGQRFTHNPNAFDPDGDSLSYRLGIPLQAEGIPVPNYQSPSEFGGIGGPSFFTINETTGTLSWDRPQREGDYNAVILIISHRNGLPIDTTTRDMQISIKTCDNLPPQIMVDNEFCLITGETLTLDPSATAPIADSAQQVRLEATSATFDLALSPATWNGDTLYHQDPWSRRYTWQTVCEHTDRYPYNLIFKATDDFATNLGGQTDLSWLEVVRIKVSAPPPLDVQIDADNGLIDLDWEAPYACEDAANDFFYGFSVWRREGSNPFPYDSCIQGLNGRGYTRISNQTEDIVAGRYAFTDDDIERGRTYCYRILGQFVRYTATGRPFNLVESLPSAEVCIQSSRDLPLLTRTDVLTTDAVNGTVDVRWTPPLAIDLDTMANPAPYTYEVLRSTGVGTSNFVAIPGTLTTYSSFTALQRDTTFLDQNLNTVANGYTYAIRFTSNGSDNGIAPLPASTIFLDIASTDQRNTLTWQAETSWENTRYEVLRANVGGFDTIASVTTTQYADVDLINGDEYCYKILGYGTYGVSTIYSPLINNSQQACGIPIDTVGPCPPAISIATICDQLDDQNIRPPFTNTISYSFGESCTPADDLNLLRFYQLSDSLGTQRTLLGEIDYPIDTIFRVENLLEIVGCYAVTAVDSVGNEGPFSATVCVANCPFYLLPNVITPNGDNQHDVLRPRINRFVERVDFVLYTRWGELVYETQDPTLGWDGTNLNGDPVPDGTYIYSCEVFQRLPGGDVERLEGDALNGTIEVFKGE
ncbi:MAG: gliding motility-associated C-terminal domain-containing protein [Saprospiraceae bacterium]